MIGKRLTELRKRANLSQKELGEQLGVSHYTISAYEKERSEPSDAIKVKLANQFNVSIDYLVGLIDRPLPFRREQTAIKVPKQITPKAQELLQSLIQEISDNQ